LTLETRKVHVSSQVRR